jgi:hypothetical protein
MGKVYRVDFETIVYDDIPGTWNSEYQNAFIYKDKAAEWDNTIIKSINESGCFVFYHTNFDGTNECWTMKKHSQTIPKATTTDNIHQLQHNNRVLNTIIYDLKEENKKLKESLGNKNW